MQRVRAQLHWWIVGVLGAATVFIWYAVAAEDRGGLLTVAMLDIGQGDAIFIESPTGNQILVDGGPPGAVLRPLGKIMPFYDRTIDMLVVTNPDKDHFGGFLDILRAYKVGAVVEPGTIGASAEYPAMEALIKEKQVPDILMRRGEVIQLGGGAALHILFPDRDVSGLATNNGSIVAQLTYGNTSVMLTGDAPQNIEHYLVGLDGKQLKSDVLKVGHHGSRTSTSAEFVGVVAPTLALISDGVGNKYGHPHQETLDTLAQFGVAVHRTDREGTITLVSDGETIRVK